MNEFSQLTQKISVIKELPLFSQFNWFELTAIARKCILEEYKKGDIICPEGAPGSGFYCLVSGRLQAYTLSGYGKKQNVEFLFRGMPFGIVSLFTGENHSRTVEALNDSIVIKIPKEDFLSISKSIPSLGMSLTQSLSKRIRDKITESEPFLENTVISIYSPVKGSGSSTYAMNLALSLKRETQRRVIFLHINSILQNEPLSPSPVEEASPQWKKPGLSLPEIIADHHKIKQHITTGESNLDLLNVSFDPHQETATRHISELVSSLVYDYYYVVVDLPNDMDDVVLQTLTQSDVVHLVSLQREKDLKLNRSVIEDIQRKLKEKFNKDNVQVIISGLDPEAQLSREDTHKILNYPVSGFLPFIERSQLNRAIVSEEITAILPDENSAYSLAVTSMARRIGGVLVGLVLGGGAALGIAHIGVIRVLEQEKIPIDIVVGSSMGAVIASLWVVGNNADQIEAIAREFEKEYKGLKLLDPTLSLLGFIGGRFIKRWLKKHLEDKTFADTKIPLKITSYDLIHRQEQIIEEGSLVEAVRESIAIPGVIVPVIKENQMIIDGGVLNPLPTNVLTRMGVKKIIAVNVLQSPEDVSKGYEWDKKKLEQDRKIPFFRSPLKFLGVRLQKFFVPNIPDIIIRTLQASEYVIAEQSAQQADIVIHPELIGVNWFEIYQVDQLIKSGEEAARAQLAKIQKLVSGS